MKFLNNTIFIGIIFAISHIQIDAATNLCFNEIMQSNINALQLEHDFPDSWVELYNPTESDIVLDNYYIGTSNSVSSAYQIPNASIKAKGFLIIQCDKKGENLHTNFRLESVNPGTIYLFNESGILVDQLSYPAMPAPNIAYGRASDGAKEWGWEIRTTPGKSNAGGLSSILLPDPIFNKEGHIMSSSQTIKITIPEGDYPEDTRIYYTTNGSEPTKSSSNNTSVSIHVNKTTIIRAKLISSSALTRPSVTNSYIFHPRSTNLPIISIATNNNYLYSDTLGILAWAKVDGISNYMYDWRRPVNSEFLVKGENRWFNQIGEVAISGNTTRSFEQKSLKVYANKRFGTKRYNGLFWKDKPNVTKTKSFVLRNGGDNCGEARINDGMIQRLFGTHASDIDYQAYSPIIVYINGTYKGIYGLRERADEDYVESNYDGLEEIFTATQESYKIESSEREASSFQPLYDLYTDSASSYEQIAELIDVDNFMQSLIAEMFANNNDYPHNNVFMWRPKDSNGKWRWILKDLDMCGARLDRSVVYFNMFKYMFGQVSENDYEYPWANRDKVIQAAAIYRKMMTFREFREPFIDKFAVWLGDFLKPSVSISLIDSMVEEIYAELAPTYSANNDFSSLTRFNAALSNLKGFCQQRPAYVYRHMADYFSLGNVIPITIKTNGAAVRINGNGLTEGDFDGAFFSNRKLNLNSGSKNIGWQMETFHYNNDSILIPSNNYTFNTSTLSLLLNDYSDCDSVSFATFIFAQSEFDNKIEELGISFEDLHDWSFNNAISFAEPQYAYANILCDSLPTTKTDDVHAYLSFYDNNGNYFQKKILFNLQGDPKDKNNYSISFVEDEWIGDITPDITFGGWVTQDEFHLKAFYSDGFRGTAEIAYQLYSQITERDNCYPRAFPISLYINGDFYGIMAWQLKKHRDNMGLNKKSASHVWLDGTLNDKRIFQDTIDWSKFEVRNPKDLYNMDGTDYDGDNPQEIIDSTSVYYTGTNKMIRSNQAKNHIINLSHYYTELSALKENGASVEEMRAAIKLRFDVPELINYMVFSLVTSNYDGFSKNWQWFTYDGSKWTVAPYDCNLTFGYNEEGTSLWPATQSSKKYDYKMENVDSSGPMFWIKKYFWDDLKERYSVLRENGIISTSNISSLANKWQERIGKENYDEEWETWPESACLTSFTESSDRFEKWVSDRIALEDHYLGYTHSTASYTLTITDEEWATICLPFTFEVPNELELYTVSDIDSDSITLILNTTTIPNAYEPYLVHGPAGNYSLFSTDSTTAQEGDLINGLLTGCIIDTFAPLNTFVLQRQNETTGFYRVNNDNEILIPAFHAYLNIIKPNQSHFRIDNTKDIIIDQHLDFDKISIYNNWGVKIDHLTSGINIVQLPNGSYKIIFIK